MVVVEGEALPERLQVAGLDRGDHVLRVLDDVLHRVAHLVRPPGPPQRPTQRNVHGFSKRLLASIRTLPVEFGKNGF